MWSLQGTAAIRLPQDRSGGQFPGLVAPFDVSELGGSVNAHKEVALAFGRLNLSNINVKVAKRVGLERLLRRLVTIDFGQSGDVVPLQTAVQ